MMLYFFSNPKKGFTLIEMLVVVAIIGILSSVLLTALGPARDKAKDSRIIQEVNQVRSYAETLYNGNYFGLEDLPANTVNNETLRSLSDDITKQGGALVIRKSSSQAGYIMYSQLNLKVGTEPDLQIQYYCVDNGGKVVFTTDQGYLENPNNTKCP